MGKRQFKWLREVDSKQTRCVSFFILRSVSWLNTEKKNKKKTVAGVARKQSNNITKLRVDPGSKQEVSKNGSLMCENATPQQKIMSLRL